MAYYEVIYETGAHSVVCGDKEEEVLAGLKVHHGRALVGVPGGPDGHTAERIKRVLRYETDPGESPDFMDLDDVWATLGSHTDGVTMGQAISDLRELANPIAPKHHPHDSRFKAQEVAEIPSSAWEGNN